MLDDHSTIKYLLKESNIKIDDLKINHICDTYFTKYFKKQPNNVKFLKHRNLTEDDIVSIFKKQFSEKNLNIVDNNTILEKTNNLVYDINLNNIPEKYTNIIIDETTKKVVGIGHLFFSILISIYAFVFRKNWFDKYYIIYNYLVYISWTFFDGECPLTYLIKKIEDPNYIAGSESTDLADMNLHFDKKSFRAFLDIFVVLNILSIFLVNRRNGYIPVTLNIILVITYFLYALFLRKFMDKEFYYREGLDKAFYWFQIAMRIFVTYLLLITI
jgi:hypothetical protein